ncbi:MAG TPA: pantoate--beta-alanine ligase [Verrucomicrobiae bacterium]|nr:pantoate--beta-alanine ligase [Verrucomicrobiae bacterium]
METIRTIAWMKEKAREARQEQRMIGLVPTMGALHAGHMALVERARKECAPVYASIFLNPAQFGPKEDLSKYPRPLEVDVEKLTAAQVDGLFLPTAGEMYPHEFSTYVHVEGLSEKLEGKSRPGHFRGVATVVLKLFEIVRPDYAYFGRKDAQQVRIIQKMAKDLNLDVELVICPTVRETDGLAMSSRNAYLDTEERRAATVLFRALKAAEKELCAGVRDTLALQHAMRKVLDGEKHARVDYAEIVDAETFEPVVRVGPASYAALAVRVGNTRLIDNMLIHAGDEVSVEL